MLDTYIEHARNFVENVNLLLTEDVDIQSLEIKCNVIFPTEDKKQEIHNKIKNEFRNFIEHLRNEIDRTILRDFTESNSIFHEMLYLDPQYSDNFNFVSLKKLCEINNIADEKKTVKEMMNFRSDFNNRLKYESILNNNECDDDDQEMYLLVENEGDINEAAMIENPNLKLKSMQGKKCKCFQCILLYFNENGRTKKYENIYKLYKYVATLPSTQVKCERDFSKMKIIKSRLRSSLGDEKMESLMIISTESDMFQNIDLEDILDEVVASSDTISLYMA